jgi:hypothetical protein
MKRSFTAVLAACLAMAPFVATAAAPSTVEARIDRSQLRRGESLTLQIRLRGEATDERPDFAPLGVDFDVVSIQPLHRTTIVNSVRDASVDWTLELRPRREGALEISARADGDRVELVVADRGPGIPAADRERVVQRLVRLDASRALPGTGLGLAFVAAVARLHRGELRLEDNAPGLRAVLRLS